MDQKGVEAARNTLVHTLCQSIAAVRSPAYNRRGHPSERKHGTRMETRSSRAARAHNHFGLSSKTFEDVQRPERNERSRMGTRFAEATASTLRSLIEPATASNSTSGLRARGPPYGDLGRCAEALRATPRTATPRTATPRTSAPCVGARFFHKPTSKPASLVPTSTVDNDLRIATERSSGLASSFARESLGI